MSQHARLGPSNHRWPHCPGSIREEARYPDTSGDAAIDGTGSHCLLEMCISENRKAESFIGETIAEGHEDKPGGWTVKKDRADRVQICLDYIGKRYGDLKEQFPDHKIEIWTETKSDPGKHYGRDDWWGTVDVRLVVINKSDVIIYFEVIDYKDGREPVDAVDNTQLLSYGWGTAILGSVKSCRMTIVQPKAMPIIRTHDCDIKHLTRKADELALAAEATDDPDAPLVPGDHCKWCKANPKRGGHCTAHVEKSLEILEMSDIAKLTQDLSTMDDEELGKLADQEEAIVNAFTKVKDEIESRIKDGKTVPGWEIAPGNSKYVWNKDEEEIVKVLRARRLKKEEIYPPKILSPAQVEKCDKLTDQQKKKIREDHVSEIQGSLKLKKVKARKKQSAKSMFEEVPVKQDEVISFF